MGNFRALRVWQESKDFAVEIYKLTNEGKISRDFGLKDQIRRAAVSIPSNIAEGDELKTNKQSIQFFSIARGSTAEVITQLIIAHEVGYFSKETTDIMVDKGNKISAMLNKLIQIRKSINK